MIAEIAASGNNKPLLVLESDQLEARAQIISEASPLGALGAHFSFKPGAMPLRSSLHIMQQTQRYQCSVARRVRYM